MKRIVSLLFRKSASAFRVISKKIYQSPEEKRVIPWFNIRGDETLRLDYDLNQESIVFDLGGYAGQWTSDIYAKYRCRVCVFEPVSVFSHRIKDRFKKNPDISVFAYGLSDKDQDLTISLASDGSSIYKDGNKSENIFLKRAEDFFAENHFDRIDLMKINIEGGEYALLEHIIDTGFVKKIKNIQVQFHDFVPDAQRKMTELQNRLNETHCVTYQFPFVWENWNIKSNSFVGMGK